MIRAGAALLSPSSRAREKLPAKERQKTPANGPISVSPLPKQFVQTHHQKKQRAVTGHLGLFMSVVLYKFDIISTSDKRCIRGTDSVELKEMSNGESRRRERGVES